MARANPAEVLARVDELVRAGDVKRLRQVRDQLKAEQAYRRNAARSLRYRLDPAGWASERLGLHLWSRQKQICDSVIAHKRTAVRSCHGVGKCAVESAVIQLADGRIAQAKDLVGRAFAILAWDEETGQHVPALAWGTDNGTRPTWRVTTNSGRTIERTGNHPLWAGRRTGGGTGRRMKVESRGWVNIEDLLVGDLVLVPEHIDVEGHRPRPETEIKLAGYLLGDGGTTVGVNFSQVDGRTLDEFKAVVHELGCGVHEQGKYGWQVVGPDGERFGRKSSNPILNLVRDWGLFGKKSKEKQLPDWVWELPNEQLALLLNRLFACDGWATAGNHNMHIGIALASERLIRDIELAMLRLGICGRVRSRISKASGKEFSCWEWAAYRLADIERFQKVVGIFGKEEAVERTVAKKRALGGRSSHWMNREAPAGHRWEAVRSLEPLGEQPTVCITVPRYHAFTTTFIEHNSLVAATIAQWWIDVHPPGEAFIVSTAPSYQQVNGILWEEIRRGALRAEVRGEPLPGRVLLSDEWKLDDGRLVGWGRKPADKDEHGFQGIHRRYVLALLDEACHDAETEVMTEFGWRRFADLDGSEPLLTMDPTSHEATYRLPRKVVAKPYVGKMFLYEAKGANYCVTPDHDMYFHGRNGRAQDTAWRKAPMSHLAGADNKFMRKTIHWKAPDAPTHEIPAFRGPRKYFPARSVPMDEWLEFLGWYCSEGSLIRQRGRINGVAISQKDYETRAEIHKLCLRLGLPAKLYSQQVHIHSRQIGAHLAELGPSCLLKRIPAYARMASARQISIFLDSFCRGDGYRKGKGEILYTSSPLMADDLQEMILKTGVPSVVHQRKLAGRQSQFSTHVATSSVDGYVVTRPYKPSKIKHYPANVREIDYSGTVYCAQIPPEHLLFTRRKGYTLWSGNCGIPEQLWTAIEAVTTTDDCRILAIGNPDDPNTEFGKVCKPGSGWNVIGISAYDSPNFTGEEVPDDLAALLLSPEWVDDKRRRWGEGSPRYVSKVLGDFPDVGDDTLIEPRWIEAAQHRDRQPGHHTVLGVDVARFGSDRTVFALARGPVVRIVADYSGRRTTETTGRVIAAKREHGVHEIHVDGVGVGSGVVDELVEHGHDVVDMQSGAAAMDSEHFANARAEWWWGLRQRFEDGDIDISADDDELAAQLGTVKYKYTARGQVLIESKDDMRKRGLPSPDRADAVMLAKAHVPPPDQIVEGEDLDDGLEAYEISPV